MHRRIAASAAGSFLLLAFFGLTESVIGLEIRFVSNWANSTKGELYTWLGFAFLATPGGLLLACGLAPLFERLASKASESLDAIDAGSRWALFFLIGSAWFVCSRLGRRFILRDFPVTDEEWAVRFGGQVLADGRFMVPVPPGWEAYTHIYMYTRDGMYTAFNWVGTQLVWALGEWVATPHLVFALLAAVPLVCLAAILERELGLKWAVVGVVLLGCSPMFATLSWTSHPHLVSRACIAATVACFVCARDGESRAWWAAMGFSFGCGVLARPVETVFLTAPLFLHLGWRALRERSRKRLAPLAAIVAGGILPAVFLCVHNAAVTGNAFTPARFAETGEAVTMGTLFDHYHPPFALLSDGALAWERFGANTAYNTLMLGVWFLGPVGVLLVTAGALSNELTRLLTIGVFCALAVSLLHDDYGLHIVGPIHYSETVVPLAVTAVHGLRRMTRFVGEAGLSRKRAVATILAGLFLSLGTLTLWHSRALHRQSNIHARIYGLLERPELRDSVVLAPQYATVWQHLPELRRTGSFVFEWRRVSPHRRERTIVLQYEPDTIPALRDDYPDRRFFRLTVHDEKPRIRVRRLRAPP